MRQVLAQRLMERRAQLSKGTFPESTKDLQDLIQAFPLFIL